MTHTYKEFFTAVINHLGLTPYPDALDAFYAVSTLEGLQGTSGNGPQRYNPLNSVVVNGEDKPYNSVGVQDYETFDNGVAGTVKLLQGSPWHGVTHAIANQANTDQILAEFAKVYDGWDKGTTADTFPRNESLGIQNFYGVSTPESTPEPPAPPREDGRTVYTVVNGDTLWDIAAHEYGDGNMFHVLATDNKIGAPYIIHPGQKLLIPKLTHPTPHANPGYEVQSGDTLWSIAQDVYGNGALYPKIAAANHLVTPYTIHPGDTLVIP